MAGGAREIHCCLGKSNGEMEGREEILGAYGKASSKNAPCFCCCEGQQTGGRSVRVFRIEAGEEGEGGGVAGPVAKEACIMLIIHSTFNIATPCCCLCRAKNPYSYLGVCVCNKNHTAQCQEMAMQCW